MRTVAVLVGVVLGAGVVSAQNLGEVARQEQQRREALGARTHVLSDGDFRRSRILEPAPEETASDPSPSTQHPALSTATAEQAGFSLGEYARRLRAERARRQAEAQTATQLGPASSVRRDGSLSAAAAPLYLGGGEPERWMAASWRAHVFTNEDFELSRILVAAPEYASPLTAPVAPSPAVVADSGAPARDLTKQPGFSLGEYARRLREQRALWRAQMELAAKRETPQPAGAQREQPSAALAAQVRKPRRRVAAGQRQVASVTPVNPESPAGADLIQVRRGDSLWKLSSAHLGEGKLWTLLWKVNPGVRNPNLIYPGQLLHRPEEAVLAQSRTRPERKAKLAAATAKPAFRPSSWPGTAKDHPRISRITRISRIPTSLSGAHRRDAGADLMLTTHSGFELITHQFHE